MTRFFPLACISFFLSTTTNAQIPIKKFIPSTFVVDSALHKEMRDSGFSYEFNRWVQVADMNNDGRKDIIIQPYMHNKRRDGVVSVFYNQSMDTTLLFKNNKPFSFYTLGDPGQFTVGDVNNDNKPDVLAPTQNYHGTPEDKSPYLYPGGGDHTPDKLFLQTNSGFSRVDFPDNFNTESANLMDVDGSGRLKILVSNFTKPMEDWKNRVPAVNTEQFPNLNWNDHVAGRNSIYDFNDDGIPDIISYESTNGSPLPPIFSINDYTGKKLYSFNVKEFKPSVRDSLNNVIYDYADLNGDGKLDLVLSYMGEWWIGGNSPLNGGQSRMFGINSFILINKGNMTFEITEIIDDPTYVQFNVTLGDWDFDDKIDILVSSMQDGIYYKNMGNNRFERRILTPLFKQALNLRGIDFDKDGKKDFINLYINQKDENGNYVSSDRSQVLSVVTNRGVTHYPVTGKSIEKNIYIGTNTISCERLNMLDGDGDGDLDLVLGYIQKENGPPTYFQEFYENKGSEFSYKPNYIEIDKTLIGELQVWTYDIDNDGDLDMFYPTYRRSQIMTPTPGPRSAYFWWENTGSKFKINKQFNLNFTEANMLYQYDFHGEIILNNKKIDTLIRNSIFESYRALPPPRPTESWKHFISIGQIRQEESDKNYFAVQDWLDNGRKLEKIRILSYKKGDKLSIFEKSDTIAIIPIVERTFTKNGRNDVYRYAPVNDWGVHIYDVDKDGKLEVVTMEYPNYVGPYDIDMPAGARIQIYDKTGNISNRYLDSAMQYDPQKISAANGITVADLNGDGLVDILPFTGWGWRSWQQPELDFWPKIDSQRYVKRVLLNTGKGFKSFHLDLTGRSEDFIQQQIGYAHYMPIPSNNSKEQSILVLKAPNQSLNAVPAIQLDFTQFKFPCSANSPSFTLTIDSLICSLSDSALLKIDSVQGYQTRWFKNGVIVGSKHFIYARDTGYYDLVITNLGGCEARKSIKVSFTPRMIPAFSINTVSQCITTNSFNFTNTSTISSGTLSYLWNFGDGSSATSTNSNRTYAATGTYIVKLITTSDLGCKDSISKQVIVNAMPAKPTISWDGSNLSAPSTYASYQWLLNNAVLAGATNAQHKPIDPGNYRVRITNTPGCADTSDVFTLLVTSASSGLASNEIIRIFPNPGSSNLSIDLGRVPQNEVFITLLTTDGRVVANWNMQQRRRLFPIDNIQRGVYLLKIEDSKGKKVSYRKFYKF